MKTYRASTKQLMHALRKCLQLLLPLFNFSHAIPEHELEPTQGRERYQLTADEKCLMVAKSDRDLFFLHGSDSRTSNAVNK